MEDTLKQILQQLNEMAGDIKNLGHGQSAIELELLKGLLLTSNCVN